MGWIHKCICGIPYMYVHTKHCIYTYMHKYTQSINICVHIYVYIEWPQVWEHAYRSLLIGYTQTHLYHLLLVCWNVYEYQSLIKVNTSTLPQMAEDKFLWLLIHYFHARWLNVLYFDVHIEHLALKTKRIISSLTLQIIIHNYHKQIFTDVITVSRKYFMPRSFDTVSYCEKYIL